MGSLLTRPQMLLIYSQNVSCDTTSEKMAKEEGNEMFFENRFNELMRNLGEINKSRTVDVIAFNEVSGN